MLLHVASGSHLLKRRIVTSRSECHTGQGESIIPVIDASYIDMKRRKYLGTIGTSVSLAVAASSSVAATDHVSIEIVDTNSPVEAGELLDVVPEIENSGSDEVSRDVELVVGEDQDVLATRSVSLEPGEVRELEFLRYRTYPVREDDEFPVAVETGDDRDETTVEVTGIDEFDEQYAEPERELDVQPETTVKFEVLTETWEDGGFNWYVDGEHYSAAIGPWSSVYAAEEGAEFLLYTFETEGTHDVAVAVGEDPRSMTQWEIEVTPEGMAPPSIEAVRPESETVPTEGDYDLEVEASTSASELDRFVWWITQYDMFTMSSANGTSDTATIGGEGCHTCETEAWVIDEHNLVTISDPWIHDEDASLDDATNGAGDGLVDVTILESNDPVTGGETLEVTAELENTGTEDVTDQVEFIVGEDPETVDEQTVTVEASEAEFVDLAFETYPVEEDDSFPVRVEIDGATDEREITVFGQ